MLGVIGGYGVIMGYGGGYRVMGLFIGYSQFIKDYG